MVTGKSGFDTRGDASRNVEALRRAGFHCTGGIWILLLESTAVRVPKSVVYEYSHVNLRAMIAGAALIELPWIPPSC